SWVRWERNPFIRADKHRCLDGLRQVWWDLARRRQATAPDLRAIPRDDTFRGIQTLLQTFELGLATVRRFVADDFFDAQQLVVLGNAIGTAQGAGLDLASGGGNRQVGDGGVFGFAGTVRNHRRVTGGLGHLDGVEGFCQTADL